MHNHLVLSGSNCTALTVNLLKRTRLVNLLFHLR